MEAIAHDRKKSIRKAREYFKLLSDTKLVRNKPHSTKRTLEQEKEALCLKRYIFIFCLFHFPLK